MRANNCDWATCKKPLGGCRRQGIVFRLATLGGFRFLPSPTNAATIQTSPLLLVLKGLGIFFFSFLDGNQTRGIINNPLCYGYLFMYIHIYIYFTLSGSGLLLLLCYFLITFPPQFRSPLVFPPFLLSLDSIYLVSTLVSPSPPKRKK